MDGAVHDPVRLWLRLEGLCVLAAAAYAYALPTAFADTHLGRIGRGR